MTCARDGCRVSPRFVMCKLALLHLVSCISKRHSSLGQPNMCSPFFLSQSLQTWVLDGLPSSCRKGRVLLFCGRDHAMCRRACYVLFPIMFPRRMPSISVGRCPGGVYFHIRRDGQRIQKLVPSLPPTQALFPPLPSTFTPCVSLPT